MRDVAQSQRAGPDLGAKGGRTSRLLLSLWGLRTCTKGSSGRDRLGPKKVEYPVPKGTEVGGSLSCYKGRLRPS